MTTKDNPLTFVGAAHIPRERPNYVPRKMRKKAAFSQYVTRLLLHINKKNETACMEVVCQSSFPVKEVILYFAGVKLHKDFFM